MSPSAGQEMLDSEHGHENGKILFHISREHVSLSTVSVATLSQHLGEWTMVERQTRATDQDLEQLITVFRLLADKTRLNILMLLAGGERNVTILCEQLGLPHPPISHHLGLLGMNNLIGNRRDGKRI